MNKLKASTLYYAIVIAFITGTITSSYIFYAYYHNKIVSHYLVKNQLHNSLQNYIKIKMLDDELEYTPVEGIALESSSKNWGEWKLHKLQASTQKDTIKKAFFEGKRIPENSKALVLNDSRQTLHMVGDAHIVGNVTIPKGRVDVGYIGNYRVSSSKLINGAIASSSESTVKMPVFDLPVGEPTTERNLKVSFFDETKRLDIQGTVIDVDTLIGNLIVYGDSINVLQGQVFEDIIIVARKVIIQSGFSGAIQVYASEGIELEENVELSYPSSLILTKVINGISAEIIINNNAHVVGAVKASSKANDRIEAYVAVNEGTKVVGMVWVNGSLDLKGEVLGEVYADQMYVRTKASSYANYMLNGVINNNEFPSFLGMPYWFNESNKVLVAKWLN